MSEPSRTFDPDLRVLADGRTIRPISEEGHVYAFPLPAGVSALRIVSRTLVPAEQGTSTSDRRRLGVAVLSLTLRSPHVEITLRANDAALVNGFYPPEAAHRWTDGDAEIPASLLAVFEDEPFTLELHLAGTPLAYPAEPPPRRR